MPDLFDTLGLTAMTVPHMTFRTAEDAVALIADGATVALVGGGGGLMEAAHCLPLSNNVFSPTGHPRDPHLFRTLGIGDRRERGG